MVDYLEWVTDPDDIELCYKLRHEVFTLEQGFGPDIDEKDSFSHHLLLQHKGMAIGTLRMFIDGKNLHLGRVCITKSYRGNGIGRVMIEACIIKGKELNSFDNLILGSQYDKTDFYKSCGFITYGDFFEEQEYTHIMMKYPL